MVTGWLVSVSPVVAAAPASAYLYRRWTTEDGLPHNTVSALHQSPSGHLWVGTWFGVARFDGQRFQAFGPEDSPVLAASVVTEFASQPDGAMWLATGTGLLRRENQVWQRFQPAEVPLGNKFWRVCLSPGGALWGLSDQGCFRVADGRAQTFGLLPNRQEALFAVLPEGEAALRFAQVDGCFRLTTAGVFTPLPLPGAPPVPWRTAAFDAAGALWIATGTNVWQPSATGFRALPLPDAPPDEIIRHLALAGPEELWVGTNRRLLHFRAGAWRVASPLAEEWAVRSLLLDRERNAWVGVEGQGLVRVRPKQIQSFTRQDGLPHDQCWSVAEAGDGTIWVGTTHSLGWVRDGQAGAVPDAGLLSSYLVRAILSDRRGRLVEAVDKLGLFEYRDGRHESLFGLTIAMHALFEDRDGTIWLGGEHIAQVLTDGTRRDKFTWTGGSPRSVRAFHQDRTGAVWMGTYGEGLYRLAESQFTRWTTQDGLPSDRVWAFHEEADGTLWLGTDGGLCRRQAGRFATLTTAHGLPENVINHILADDFGHFWISCNRGIYRVAAAELHAVADGRQPRAHVRLYGEREGMANAETNGENQPAGCKARDGRLWFPTVKGVVALDPRDFHDDTNAPPVLLEEFHADGVPRWREGTPHAPSEPLVSLSTAHAHALEFHYTAVSLTAPGRVRFLHRLTGLETEWKDAGARRVATYANLPPGDYRFQVRAVNHHGYTNLAGVNFAFTLTPQWHQSYTFRAGLGLFVLAGAVALHAVRLRGQRRIAALERRHALELERARIARDLHDNLGADLSQMTLLGEQAGLSGTASPGNQQQFLQFSEQARAATRSLSEVVWATSAKHDHLPAFINYLADLAPELLAAGNVRCRLELPDEVPPLPLDGHLRHELLLILKESLNNIVRHARATQATLTATLEQHTLTLVLTDNGCGFDPAEAAQRERTAGGNGLPNLQARAAALGATLHLQSAPGQGTTLTVTLVLPG